jgi:hypothetical protein
LCSVLEFLCIHDSLRKAVKGETGDCWPIVSTGRVDREVCAMKTVSRGFYRNINLYIYILKLSYPAHFDIEDGGVINVRNVSNIAYIHMV